MALASQRLVEKDMPPLPDGLTPHSLRRTFASVMDEIGHTDPALALRIYRQSMRRDQGEKDRLRALIEGAEIEEADEPRELAVIGRQPAEPRRANLRKVS